MKKYLPYIIAILLLGGAAYWFGFRDTPESVNQREGDFAVKNEKDITKVVMEDIEKRHVELTRTAEGWTVNGKDMARAELIQQLMDAITRVTSLAPVPSKAHDNVLREIMGNYIKVDVYTDNEKVPAKSYWVGGPTVDGKATYMLLQLGDKTANRPHMVYVPGNEGYLTPRFSTYEEDWRTRILFNYAEKDIQSVSVEYPYDEKSSFSVTRVADDSFALNPLDEKFRINQPYQQKYVKQYLSFYNEVYIEAFDNDHSKKDSIVKTQPYCVFNITTTKGATNAVKVFYMPINKRSKAQYDTEGRELSYDVDRFYASIHDGKDFAIVQYYVMGKTLRKYHEFYFKPGEK